MKDLISFADSASLSAQKENGTGEDKQGLHERVGHSVKRERLYGAVKKKKIGFE